MSPLERHAGLLKEMAAGGLVLGTSSWKYPGWLGQIYQHERYLTRGRFSEARFERSCLAEYAETFAGVCVDASYYRFPTAAYLEGLAEQVGEGFTFSHKVPDAITVKTFPNLPRHGALAGKPNPHFLDAEVFRKAFLGPLERHRDRTGLLILEFSRFHPRDFARGRDFLTALDVFLGRLPTRDWDIAVELRNRSVLRDEYFEVIEKHGVGHVYNQWTLMPPASEQLAMRPPSGLTGACGMRLLLKPGRTYEEAVTRFQPYDRMQEEQPDARRAAVEFLLDESRSSPRRRGFLFVNNRLEGNALATLAAILDAFGVSSGRGVV